MITATVAGSPAVQTRDKPGSPENPRYKVEMMMRGFLPVTKENLHISSRSFHNPRALLFSFSSTNPSIRRHADLCPKSKQKSNTNPALLTDNHMPPSKCHSLFLSCLLQALQENCTLSLPFSLEPSRLPTRGLHETALNKISVDFPSAKPNGNLSPYLLPLHGIWTLWLTLQKPIFF